MRKFLHSSDLHLGRQFGQFPADVASHLAEARFDVIGSLAKAARDAGISDIILAGDTWDSETPSDRILRQSLDRFAAEHDIRWLLLPGNHDPIGAGSLWQRIAQAQPTNLIILSEAKPQEIAPGVCALPSPCTATAEIGDPSQWMTRATSPEGTFRLGIAHGGVLSFGEEGDDTVISPNRAKEAGLNYLALGDWHGWLTFGDRTLYSGTPEPDRFREGSGFAALVTLTGPDAPPRIEQCAIGKFRWLEHALDAESEPVPSAALERVLEHARPRSDVLLSLKLTGTLRPEVRSAWAQATQDLGLSLRHLRVDDSDLVSLVAADDLDLIDRHGALRAAADRLLALSNDADAAGDERAAASLALDLLFTWSTQDAEVT